MQTLSGTTLDVEASGLMHPERRILLAQRACAELYPPVLHQAALLREVGSVILLDAIREGESPDIQTPPDVRRVRVPALAAASPVLARIEKIDWLRRYVREFRRLLSSRPEVVIAFEPEAASLLLNSRFTKKGTRRVVHLHELPWRELYSQSFSGSWALRYMLKNLRRADIVIVPDQHRGRFVRSAARLDFDPMVVMNCPPRIERLPESSLIPFLRGRGIETGKIVHYQGAVGPDHGLETVVRSMRFWPPDAIFTIVGGTQPNYAEELSALAASEGVRDRVVFVGRVPYKQVAGYAAGAKVGVTLLDPTKKNWEMSAGASNKRFEYAALGIPQVTNEGVGIEELFGKTGAALVADNNDCEDVGKKISKLLEDEALSRSFSERARRLHLREFNYEYQYRKVLTAIA